MKTQVLHTPNIHWQGGISIPTLLCASPFQRMCNLTCALVFHTSALLLEMVTRALLTVHHRLLDARECETTYPPPEQLRRHRYPCAQPICARLLYFSTFAANI